jgi:Fuc2NAc and GlcNAc transferase
LGVFLKRRLGSHTPVTLAVGAINLLWLLPLALTAALGWIPGLLAILIAYTPLVLLAFHYKAGSREEHQNN